MIQLHIIPETNWDCKQSNPLPLPSAMKNRTWGDFEKTIFDSCDECKKFCDLDENCDGFVCVSQNEFHFCYWMKKELKQQCKIKDDDNYLTCWKEKRGELFDNLI